MGNFLSTEEFAEGDEHHHEERTKPERKKRKARAKTAKRRGGVGAPPPVDEFSFFSDPGDSLEQHKERENEEEVNGGMENYNFQYEEEPVTKPKRKKRGGATISRRKRIAWEDEDNEAY